VKGDKRVDLWILRHAEAEDRAPSGRDEDRRLTSDGRRRMDSVARAIAGLKPDFDRILASPLVRARETAAPVADALGSADLVLETEALTPDSDPRDILAEVDRRSLKRVLLVGHNPHLASLLGLLIAGDSRLPVEMKKASLARFEARPRASDVPASLRFFLPPGILERLGSENR
jgi:phosphohistidine phosphatase